MQQSQGPSHIPIREGILLLRCFWKVGIPLESKPGNQLSCPVQLWLLEVFLIVAVTSWSLWTCESVLAETLEYHQGPQTPFLFEMEHEIVLYAMPGDQASSRGKGKVSWFFPSCVANL